MVYFDTSLDFAPVAEQNTDPILPEDRFVFELIGLERSEPDQWRKNGGIKWTWKVWNMDGSPFVFKDEQYTLWRTTGVNANGVPNINVGTQANEWASAMLGRPLDVDATLRVSELRGKKMSAMVVWQPQKSDPKKKSVVLASLRHVPSGAKPADRTTVSADPTPEDVDRALILTKIPKQIARLKKLDAEAGASAAAAWADSDEDAPIEELKALSEAFSQAIQNAVDADD